MKKTVNITSAFYFDIYCCDNDSVDIRCGGPATLGYEFYVDGEIPENEDIFKQFIKEMLNKYHRKYKDIYVRKIEEHREDHLWTKEMIEKCIKENCVC